MSEADGNYPLIYFSAADPNESNFTTKILETQWEPYVETLRPEEYTFVHRYTDNGLQFSAAYSTRATSKS